VASGVDESLFPPDAMLNIPFLDIS